MNFAIPALRVGAEGEVVVTPPPTVPGTFAIGVNLAGLEFASNKIPGIAGTDYGRPSDSAFSYYHGKNLNLVRLPFKWQRLQPILNGPLDADYLKLITDSIDAASARSMQVIVDMHDYGGYGSNKLGDGTLTSAHFADVWGRIATALVGKAGLKGYGLMNEPNNMPNSTAWPDAAQAARDAIRAVDTNTLIYCAGDHYSSAGTWTTYNENLSINDAPYNKVVYEAHMYLDWENSGTHPDWNESVALGVTVNTGVERLAVFVDWLKRKQFHGFIGECGAYKTDPNWLIAFDNAIGYMQQNNLEFCAWAGGRFGTSYIMSLTPFSSGMDQVQMAVLTKYSGAAQPTTYYWSGPTRGTANLPSSDFTVFYRGIVTTPITVMYSDNGAGGTFSNLSAVILPGFNGQATFQLTLPANATAKLTATNDSGLTNPKYLGYSTKPDMFMNMAFVPRNIFSSRRLFSPYVGPAVRLRRDSDNAEMDFDFNQSDEDDKQAIADWAGYTFSGGQYSGSTRLYVVYRYDQSPNGYDAGPVFSDNSIGPATLADQPEYFINGQNNHPTMRFLNNRMDATSPVDGLTAYTVLIVAKAATSGGMSRLVSHAFVDNLAFTGDNANSGMWIDSNESTQGVNAGIDSTAWHPYAGRMRCAT